MVLLAVLTINCSNLSGPSNHSAALLPAQHMENHSKMRDIASNDVTTDNMI